MGKGCATPFPVGLALRPACLSPRALLGGFPSNVKFLPCRINSVTNRTGSPNPAWYLALRFGSILRFSKCQTKHTFLLPFPGTLGSPPFGRILSGGKCQLNPGQELDSGCGKEPLFPPLPAASPAPTMSPQDRFLFLWDLETALSAPVATSVPVWPEEAPDLQVAFGETLSSSSPSKGVL